MGDSNRWIRSVSTKELKTFPSSPTVTGELHRRNKRRKKRIIKAANNI